MLSYTMKTFRLFLSVFALVILSVSHTAHAQNTEQQVSELYDLATQLRADYGSLSRFYAIWNSPERRERFEQFFNDYSQKLSAYNFNKLSRGGQVDYILIDNYIKDHLYQLREEAKEYNAVREWVAFAEPIYAIEKLRRRGKHLNSEEVASQLNTISTQLESTASKLKKGSTLFPKNLTDRAQGIIRGHIQALKSVYDFYNGYDPQFGWWVSKPYEKLTKELNEYATLIQTKVDPKTQPADDGSGIIGNPIGRTELIRQLKQEMIPYTPEELVDMAMKEFAWCDEELLKASREMGFGDDWRAAQEKVKMSFVPAGQQPEAMLELYDQSVAFLKDNDLISIPSIAEETWRMTMIPPERQLISPFFLGGEVLQISYPTDEMEHADKLMSMRGNNPHFSRSTVHHELIAGHHMQRFMNNRYKSYRFFGTPFWTEGWALYWELLLWDMDFPRSPEDRIGMLFWRMHRCARIIFSLNYHLGKWTPQQCIDYLVDRVGHERANAEGEVRRSFTGGYGPLYQIAYMVGGQQFYALKRELVDSGKMTLKEFHDAVMRENAMPVEMVRALLTNEKLSKNFETSWRFYNNELNRQSMKKY
ncbi:X-Pro dipeptidyl-peptidase [Roseivirga thermotolerans]|uniref:X-Pro dipeptidyl-peptidase n=2 Tax=Roseivirga thermotolerans TaxID=1758176 RepID=A0ABQ3ICT6_9BACT|nr:X-Pro dipeptidyl-peptidase [Roseivirga thermotolerans]